MDTGLAGKANSSHTHTSVQITDLNTTLSNTLRPYATTNTVNTELDKKANKSHTHTVSQITDMPKVVLTVNGNGPDGSGNVSVPTGVTPNAYVTSAWRSGAQWYRRWSDGWLEQGGRLELKVSTGDFKTFSLPTAFSNATYTTVVTGEGGYGTSTIKVGSYTTSSVTLIGTGETENRYVSYVHFYCSGY